MRGKLAASVVQPTDDTVNCVTSELPLVGDDTICPLVGAELAVKVICENVVFAASPVEDAVS